MSESESEDSLRHDAGDSSGGKTYRKFTPRLRKLLLSEEASDDDQWPFNVSEDVDKDPLDSFAQFSSLPAELRIMIWEAFDPYFFSETRVFNLNLVDYCGKADFWEAATSSAETSASRALMATNRESRRVGMKRYPHVLPLRSGSYDIRLDFSKDIVNLGFILTYPLHISFPTGWASQIQYLALNFSVAHSRYTRQDLLGHMFGFDEQPSGFENLKALFYCYDAKFYDYQQLDWSLSKTSKRFYLYVPQFEAPDYYVPEPRAEELDYVPQAEELDYGEAMDLERLYCWPDITLHQSFRQRVGDEYLERFPDLHPVGSIPVWPMVEFALEESSGRHRYKSVKHHYAEPGDMFIKDEPTSPLSSESGSYFSESEQDDYSIGSFIVDDSPVGSEALGLDDEEMSDLDEHLGHLDDVVDDDSDLDVLGENNNLGGSDQEDTIDNDSDPDILGGVTDHHVHVISSDQEDSVRDPEESGDLGDLDGETFGGFSPLETEPADDEGPYASDSDLAFSQAVKDYLSAASTVLKNLHRRKRRILLSDDEGEDGADESERSSRANAKRVRRSEPLDSEDDQNGGVIDAQPESSSRRSRGKRPQRVILDDSDDDEDEDVEPETSSRANGKRVRRSEPLDSEDDQNGGAIDAQPESSSRRSRGKRPQRVILDDSDDDENEDVEPETSSRSRTKRTQQVILDDSDDDEDEDSEPQPSRRSRGKRSKRARLSDSDDDDQNESSKHARGQVAEGELEEEEEDDEDDQDDDGDEDGDEIDDEEEEEEEDDEVNRTSTPMTLLARLRQFRSDVLVSPEPGDASSAAESEEEDRDRDYYDQYDGGRLSNAEFPESAGEDDDDTY